MVITNSIQDKRRAINNKWRNSHPDYDRQWYITHRDSIRQRAKIYRLSHKEQTHVYEKQYYSEHKKECNSKTAELRTKIKRQVLTFYGNDKCACVKCGFDDVRALSIDHINGNGAKQRQQESGLRGGGIRFYTWLIKNNYPKGYQTLCMNCQFIKRQTNNEYNGKDLISNKYNSEAINVKGN